MIPDPFELVQARVDTRGKDRIQRRALSDAGIRPAATSCGQEINWLICCPCMRVCGSAERRPKTLRWCDLVLGESGGLLRLQAAVNKNRKEQSLPLHHELAKALQQQKPANGKADDLVLVNGVPDMDEEFRTGLGRRRAMIPFLDERGRRSWIITRCQDDIHPRASRP